MNFENLVLRFQKTGLKLSNDQIFDTLRSSVEMSLTADVDVSVLLSGGIDSTIVAAIAKDIGHSLTSYTIDIGDIDYTEAEIAREMKSLGLAHQPQVLHQMMLVQLFRI